MQIILASFKKFLELSKFPDFCPPTGDCGVYVIWSKLTDGGVQVEKYGKTCQPNQKRNPDVNPTLGVAC